MRKKKPTPPPAPEILLSPDLRKKVTDKTVECFSIASKKYKKKFVLPEIRFDIKNWTAGMAVHSKNIVRYNLILLVENEEHFIEHVIPHEVAHFVNRQVNKVPEGKKKLMPHGNEWKSIMTDLYKVPADTKHLYDCSSIEKIRQNRRPKVVTLPVPGGKGTVAVSNRVRHLILQIHKLDETERAHLELFI